MSTPEFEVHRAIVHSSNVTTGAAEVRIPSLLGAGQTVNIPTTGLTQVSGLWNVPSAGTSVFVAVSADRTQFLWITAVTTPSSGDDQEIVDSLQFNIDAGLAANQEGLLVWNEDWGTVDIGLHGTKAILHIGQQVYYYAKNQTGSQIDKGTVVRFDGALGASGHLKMAPFLADGTYPSEYIMGITAHDIPDGDDGYVVHFGAIRGIDTDTPNWNAGDVLYVSPTVTGGLTTTVPTAPNNIVLVAAVINRHQNNGELFVRPTIAANILKDEGIIYTNLSDNQLLSYDSAQGVFVNESFSPTITLAGDATGSVTLTDLGSGTLTVSVVDDSHSHSYVPTSGGTVTGNLDVNGTLTTDYIKNDNGNFIAIEGGDAWDLGSNASGEYVWLAAEGGLMIVSSDSNDVTWANREQIRITAEGGIDNKLRIHGRIRTNITGEYGSVETGGNVTWDGYSIDGRVVFMHDGGSNWGIYNDVNNEWMLYGQLNGDVELRYNNLTRFQTTNSGVQIDNSSGNADCFLNAREGYYAIYYMGDGGTKEWHFEAAGGGGTWAVVETGVSQRFVCYAGGGAWVSGYLNKSGGGFRIPHPHPDLNETHDLVHNFVEGPQADNIYRGRVQLVNGTASVNIDTASGMTEGTFVLLNRDIQCFTSNEEGPCGVWGYVEGNTLHVTAQHSDCNHTISWMVIGERQDEFMITGTDATDETGKVIVEPLKREDTSSDFVVVDEPIEVIDTEEPAS